MKIIVPNNMKRDQLRVPDENEYKILVNDTFSEIGSIRIDLENKKISPELIAQFICDFLLIQRDILESINKLTFRELHPIYILMRSQLEFAVDLFWTYSIFFENKKIGENIVKRFYHFGAANYLDISNRYFRIIDKDPFVKEHLNKSTIVLQREAAKKHLITDIYDCNCKDDKLVLQQKRDWRSVPFFIKNVTQTRFDSRCKRAIKLVQMLSNLKEAPYIMNWKILNLFTHPNSISMRSLDDEIAKSMYKRNLDISLGIVHDCMNIAYNYLKQNPDLKTQMNRNVFHWLSL
jgi:hypothetical protein